MNAVLYARFSPRPDASKCESIEVQLDRCRAYCRAHAYDVVGEFEDRELSGGRADNRPGLQEAIALACREQAVLVVYKLDRFARKLLDTAALLETLTKAGAELASISESFNTKTSSGKLVLNVMASFCQYEREIISERTSNAMLYHQSKGRLMTRPDQCPYGKKIQDGRLVEHVGEQCVIETMLQLEGEGHDSYAISRALLTMGLVRRNGKPWTPQLVRSVLKRERGAA